MDIRVRVQALQYLTRKVAGGLPQSHVFRVRLATRWLRAGLERDMDMLLRLQVLEGAAGVPVDTWMKKQQRGLAMAKAHLDGTAVNPEWFSPNDTGMFTIIRSSVQKIINQLKLRRVEPFDVISGYLMGLSVNINGPEVKRPAYAVGQKDSEGILSGKETPQKIGKGRLSRYYVNKVWPEERKQKDIGIPTDDEGRPMEFADPSSNPALDGTVDYDHDAFGDFISEIVFRNLHDPLGMKIRDLMRASWHDSEPMLMWLSIVENEHRYPRQKEVADKAGVNPSVFNSRHWKPRWLKFLRDLRTKSNLLQAVKEKAREEGIAWDSEEMLQMDPDTILAPRSDRSRPRAASSSFLDALTIRVAQRFLHRS